MDGRTAWGGLTSHAYCKEWADAVKNKKTFKSEFRLIYPYVKITWVLCIGIPLFFSDVGKREESSVYIAAITDITERKFM
ncbi:hypothetical protein KsCSTR_21330 [Candidatus Kuenenia stuttgartiensis]|jgi:hypothetical protein|uniref:PAC domain-containing protein n=1 Tax=Kuenenia stuttgartiensis TaxID=174633 RepID=Q1Q313_KUEST|nr:MULTISPECIES: hypothetical protein [Kuenenia]MBE7548516.1 hypothetical protein [Planctomycetia bacterium]MBW7942607.1 hypothetical protein [Candidatus Kuenenia stuttgartiensis]MBZ0190994.1 hypothetical protein [Candidatus Kuenenia stuttgartiensis]MCL4728387.1 hypothetical protein [Candidatus Kuenenia stuttgartiensis]MCZ7622110.1 hypothetical protein [Candidatus Kuenenia sp.]